MNKINDEIIRKEVIDYWVGYNNLLIKTAKFEFLKEASRRDIKVKGFGNDQTIGISVPDYKSLKLDSEMIQNRIRALVTDRTAEIIIELINECVLDYNSLFCNTETPIVYGIYGHVRKIRKRLITIHKKNRQKFPSRIKDLKKLQNIMSYSYPTSNRDELQNAINSINHLHAFSESLIDFLENEWHLTFNLDKNIDKNPIKHSLWDKIIENMYRILTTKANPPFKKMEACTYIVKFLGSVYPTAWSGNLKQNITSVKNRIYNNDL